MAGSLKASRVSRREERNDVLHKEPMPQTLKVLCLYIIVALKGQRGPERDRQFEVPLYDSPLGNFTWVSLALRLSTSYRHI